MQIHHLRCHQADEEDAEPRRESQPSLTAHPTRRLQMPSIYEEEVHRTPLQRSSYGSRPRDYPPPSQQYLGGSTLIGSGYSSYAHDSFYDGPRVAGSGRDSLADGGSRDGSQGRRSGVSRESTRSGCNAYTDDERRDQEATEAWITGEVVAVIVGVGQAAGPLEADRDPEATEACLTGEAVAVRV